MSVHPLPAPDFNSSLPKRQVLPESKVGSGGTIPTLGGKEMTGLKFNNMLDLMQEYAVACMGAGLLGFFAEGYLTGTSDYSNGGVIGTSVGIVIGISTTTYYSVIRKKLH